MATLRRSLRRFLLGSLAVTVAAVAGVVWTPPDSRPNLIGFFTTLVVSALMFGAVIALPAARASECGFSRLARGTYALAVIAVAMMLALILGRGFEFRDDLAGRLLGAATVPVGLVAVAAAFACAMISATLVGWMQRVRLIGIGAGGVFAALIAGMIVADSGNRVLFKIAGVLLLVALSTGILTWVAQWRRNRLSRGRSRTAP